MGGVHGTPFWYKPLRPYANGSAAFGFQRPISSWVVMRLLSAYGVWEALSVERVCIAASSVAGIELRIGNN
jgi:hypothetical protein